MTTLIQLLNEYGYIVIFFSLLLELIIIPIPNEALMSYVGILAFQGKLNIALAIFSAGIGGIIGATISYWVGTKLGAPFFRKYGRYIHLGPEKMVKMEAWYRKYGKVLLIFSYIVPGIRHVASIISGVIKLPYRSFAVFSYIGIFLWVNAYIFLGYSLGPEWNQYKSEIEKWLVLASIALGLIILAYIVIKVNRQFIKESLILIFEATFKRFKSFYKVKILIFLILALFTSLFALMVGMTQDFVANEFGRFNSVFHVMVFAPYGSHWLKFMNVIHALSSIKVLGVFILLTVLIIVFNRKNIWLELLFFVITLMGTYLFSFFTHWLFHFLFSGSRVGSHFPDGRAMLLTSVLSFFLYMLIRHRRNYLVIPVLFICFALTLAAYSFSMVLLEHSKPSDIIGGYVFGGAWITGMFFALEIFRFLAVLKKESKNQAKR